MRRLLSAACAVLALVAFSSSVLAQAAYWTGNTTGGPTMARPLSFSGTSGVGTAVPYEVQPFFVGASGQYEFEVDSQLPFTHTDQYALVYANAFDPSTPLANLIAGDDDYAGPYTVLSGFGTASSPAAVEGSRIGLGEGSNFGGAGTGLNLQVGTQYYAVVAGFGNTDSGTYQAAIGGGPGSVTLGIVPEPGAALGVVVVGIAAVLRRRRA